MVEVIFTPLSELAQAMYLFHPICPEASSFRVDIT